MLFRHFRQILCHCCYLRAGYWNYRESQYTCFHEIEPSGEAPEAMRAQREYLMKAERHHTELHACFSSLPQWKALFQAAGILLGSYPVAQIQF